MKHSEYTIVIHPTKNKQQCQRGMVGPPHPQYPECKNEGLWGLRIVDDRDNVLEQYEALCDPDLIMLVTLWMVQH